MDVVAETLRYVNIALLAALAAVSFQRWRGERSAPAGWVALAFGGLAALFALRVASRLLGDVAPDLVLLKLTVVLAVLFPYFLYRFAASLSRPPRAVGLLALSATGVLATWGLLLPEIPLGQEARPLSLTLFIVALLAQWTWLSLFVALRLWRAGGGQPSVVRRRMRLLSLASVALSLAIAVAGLGPGDRPPSLDVSFRLLVFTSALMFFVGFAPPRVLRIAWRRPEEEAVRRATGDLIAATSQEEVMVKVLPAMARTVGATGVALVDANGRTVAAHGLDADALRPVDGGSGEGGGRSGEVVRVPLAKGTLVVSTTPYTPLFGSEEFALLRSLAAFTLLALDRSRLFEQEREARRALERADELKSNFIALASHELRNPVAIVYGLSETLVRAAGRLPRERVDELRRTLHEQIVRLKQLVEQLLDLSRVEAEAIEIRPERLPVRERVEELVHASAGERAGEVSVDVDPELEATADAEAFDRVVTNLIANALRYGDPPVTISAEQRDRHFRLTVEDRGPGVPPEFVPQLFEPFARSEASRGRSEGTGLGLAIARSYAHAHGGELVYERVEPRGARFQLVLPRLNGGRRPS